MKYVKHFDILGVDTAQIPCIELQGAPNAATVGAVGLLGMDMTSEGHEIYKCVAVNGSVYTWECLAKGKDGTCVNKAEIIDGKLILTLSDGTEINAGVVQGETGKAGKDGKDGVNGIDGVNGEDGKDGISVVGADFNEDLELVLTLSNGTTITAGKVIPEIKDFMGTIPIGSPTQPIYYDGEKFTDASFAPREFTLESATWEQIKAIADAGKASEYFYVGEEKTVKLGNGETINVVILGFNHDYTKNEYNMWNRVTSISFGMRNLLANPSKLGSTGYVKTYGDADIIINLLKSYEQLLPAELETNIVEVLKGFYGSDSNQVLTVPYKLFLLSTAELGCDIGSSTSNTSKCYEYYLNQPNRRIKLMSNGSGDINKYWTRDYGCTVGTNGEVNQHNVDTVSAGICFGFCI